MPQYHYPVEVRETVVYQGVIDDGPGPRAPEFGPVASMFWGCVLIYAVARLLYAAAQWWDRRG